MSESKTHRLKASSRRAGRKHLGTVMIFLFLLVLGVFMVLPIWLMFVNSVKPVNEMFVFPPKWYTLNPTLDNFKDTYRVLGQMWVPFSRYVFNSVLVTLSVTVMTKPSTGSFPSSVTAAQPPNTRPSGAVQSDPKTSSSS